MIIGGDDSTCKILFADNDLSVVLKPPGLFVHPSALDRKLPDCRSILEATHGRRLYNIHRIDRPASGLVLFAHTKSAASALSEQFRSRTVKKRYLAIVRGHVPDKIRIEYPLAAHRGAGHADAVSVAYCLSRSVVDEPVGAYQEGWFSLTEIRLESGRPHQARRHLKHIGHPIIGDTQHGDGHQNRFARSKFGTVPLCLRAFALKFTHPASEKTMECCAGLPEWWLEILGGLGLPVPPEISLDAEVSQTS